MFSLKPAICYSGYRQGQSPRESIYPSDQEVLDDLIFLSQFVGYLRMYDTSYHAEQVLRLIKKHQLDLKVMLGVEPLGELDNLGCSYGGRYTESEIQANRLHNYTQLDAMLTLSQTYSDQVLALSVGNENTSDWHPNLMPESSLVDHVNYLKSKTSHLITFCEGTYFWHRNKALAEVVDFISIHSYPQWHKKTALDAIEFTKKDYHDTKTLFSKPVIFTEYGWTTETTEVMLVEEANESNQALYLEALSIWSKTHHIQMFLFEAFDESWKGSKNPLEPEKHWGIFNEDRTPKLWQKKKLTYEL
jgi:exo-beta-1,3-glucanase (GH17 family)